MAGKRTSLGEAAKPAANADSGQRVKLIIAVVALVLATGLVVWHFGVFDNPNKPMPPQPPIEETLAPEVREEYKRIQKKTQEEAVRRPPPAGS